MVTDASKGAGEHGPPWSLLGIAPTGDKAAIEAAYAERRAQLNAEDARISAFADQLSNQMGRERYGFSTIEGYVRGQAVRSRSVAGFDELVALGELKRVWMTAAMREPARVCQNVMVGDFNSIPLLLTQEEAESERRYLRQLLDAGVLSHLGGREGEEFRFDVPGWAVERTIRDSGLSDAQVVAALRDPDHEMRCRVEYALLGAVLEQPGRVSEDLLRGL